MDNYYMDRWCLGVTYGFSGPVKKTIYDPSPYGYTVPDNNAFRNFTTVQGTVTDFSLMNGIKISLSNSTQSVNGLMFYKAGTAQTANPELDENLFFLTAGDYMPVAGAVSCSVDSFYLSYYGFHTYSDYAYQFYYDGIKINTYVLDRTYSYHAKAMALSIRPALEINP